MNKVKVLHIITSSTTGGAEQALFSFLSAADLTRFQYEVVTLAGEGPLTARIRQMGTPVTSLGMAPGKISLQAFRDLVQIIKIFQPDLIHTWLYHADLMGGVAARLAGKSRLVWGIHHTSLDRRTNKTGTLFVARVCALLSGFLPDRIFVCAKSALEGHSRFGYARSKMEFIPNGINVNLFHWDADARRKLRQEFNIIDDQFVIGFPARFHPLKDHETFIRAAGILRRGHEQVKFVLCGNQIDPQNEQLMRWIKEAKIEEATCLLGNRTDMPQVLSMFDTGTLSSVSEAFPVVLGEMMACELPCVVTNAGDMAEIIGDTGILVSPGCPEELAQAWEKIIRLNTTEKARLGQKARNRVIKYYSLDRMVDRYQNAYFTICTGG